MITTTNNLNNPLTQQAAEGIERAGAAAEQSVQQVRDRVMPAAVRLASQAEDLAHRSLDAMRDGSQQLRERAVQASDRGIGYVRDEPVKAVLIAAAAGATLMMLAQLISSRRR